MNHSNPIRVNHAPVWLRIAAMALGLYTLEGLARPRHGGIDWSIWWIDMRFLPAWMRGCILAAAVVALLGLAAAPQVRLRRWIYGLPLAVVLSMTLWNTLSYYMLLARGAIYAGPAIPLSVMVSLVLAMCLLAALGRSVRVPLVHRLWVRWTAKQSAATMDGHPVVFRLVFLSRWTRIAGCALAIVAIGLVGAVALMYTFGKTDYRRTADAAVVFGAGVWADGTPSDALKDRVRTGVELYQQGLVKYLVMSGGPGPGSVHETQAMSTLAQAAGVPAQAILVDEQGVNTRSSVENTVRLFGEKHFTRVLAVSHFYHVPRIKSAYMQAGVEVYTVPARESYLLTAMPYYVAREAVAIWAYHLPGASGK